MSFATKEKMVSIPTFTTEINMLNAKMENQLENVNIVHQEKFIKKNVTLVFISLMVSIK